MEPPFGELSAVSGIPAVGPGLSDLFIAVEGPIGVGKTTLMRRLAETCGLRAEREIVGENPFLADFYADTPRWAFQTEMFFLTSRYTQLRDVAGNPRGVVADFHLRKNLVFARRTLSPAEHDRLVRVYDVLVEDLPMPDLTVFLDAELPVLRRRIAERGRDFETQIADDYLQGLREDYEQLAETMRAAGEAVVRIDVTDTDILGDETDFAAIRSRIEATAREARRAR